MPDETKKAQDPHKVTPEHLTNISVKANLFNSIVSNLRQTQSTALRDAALTILTDLEIELKGLN